MDPNGQAKTVAVANPKVGPPPTPNAAPPGNPTATDSTRQSQQMGSALDSINGQGPMTAMVMPGPGIPPPNYDPRDSDLTKRFRLILIVAIAMDIIAVTVSIMVTSFYESLTRKEFLSNGTMVNTETFILQEERPHSPHYVNRAKNLAEGGIYIVYASAGVCGFCFIMDVAAIFIARSLIGPKGRIAMLMWFISTASFIVFCVIQVIILTLIMFEDKHLFPRDVDMIEQREDWETEKTMLIVNSYVTLLFLIFLFCTRADLLKPGFAIKKMLRQINAGPVLISPPATPETITSPTGPSTLQNTGKAQAY